LILLTLTRRLTAGTSPKPDKEVENESDDGDIGEDGDEQNDEVG